MRRILFCWMTGITLWTGVAAGAQVTCQTFTPPDPILPSNTVESQAFDVSAYDYYAIYITDRGTTRPTPFEVTVFHGADIPGLFPGFAHRRYGASDFIGLLPDEYRLNPEAEWITRSPIRIMIQNRGENPEQLWHASICFGRILPASTAGVDGMLALVLTALPVLLGALFLRGRRLRIA